MLLSAVAAAAALGAQLVNAASADDWRNRTIYQVITDRFAPPSETAPARTDPLPADCDPAAQTWCGGTWLSIVDKLDYIQSMGFDAIWISPTSRNIDFQTPYNFAYHGYWVNDVTQINQRFGSEDDLKHLSDEVHKRGMYLMVDVVVNGIPALSNTTQDDPKKLQDDGSLWTQTDYFHQFCTIDWSNDTSVKYCSLGDDKLPLIDVNTEHPHVITTLQSWISEFVAKFGVDGLRIDAAKHVPGEFWQGFCGAAGVFCMGEVFDDKIDYCADFQNKQWMDSILGYPFYNGLYKAFGVAPKGNMSELTDRIVGTLKSFPNPGLLGNFLENHDTPRFRNVTADPQLAYNAMVMQFMFDGIPVLYYGQEQDMSIGAADPYNRAALWPLGYENGTTVQRVTRLNKIRQSLLRAEDIQFDGKSYLQSQSTILANTTYDVAIRKGPVVLSVTNRGSPEEPESFAIDSTGFPARSAVVDLLSCHEFVTGAGGSLSVSYLKSGYGGMPYVWVAVDDAKKMGFCTDKELGIDASSQQTRNSKSDAMVTVAAPSLLAGCLFTVATALGAAYFL